MPPKAAAVIFSDHQRIKLAPFGITVVDLKAGWVKSNFHRSRSDESRLPKRSIYEPMRAEAERAIRAEHLLGRMDLDVWAKQSVGGSLEEGLAGAGMAWGGGLGD